MIWLLLISFNLSSVQARDDIVPGSRYTSARAAALGDAFLPLGEDGPSALFYNPAAVARIRHTQVEPMNVTLQANGGFMDNIGLNSYKAYSLSSNLPNLTAAPGAVQGVGFSLLPSFYGKGFALGVLLQEEMRASSDADGNVQYRSQFQFIPAASVGVRLASGIVRFGYSLQWVNKAAGDISVPSGTTPLGYNQSLPQGSGFSHNLGFALTLPILYLPSLNVVARNLGGVTYSMPSLVSFSQGSPGAPATEAMSFDGSLSMQAKIEQGVYSNLVLQYRDMTNSSQVAILGRLTAGVELSLRDAFFLRGGYGGGYPSAGLGVRLRKGEFSMSWYSQEIGTRYQDHRDVRYMFQYQVRAF